LFTIWLPKKIDQLSNNFFNSIISTPKICGSVWFWHYFYITYGVLTQIYCSIYLRYSIWVSRHNLWRLILLGPVLYLEMIPMHKDLGIMIPSNLSWEDHNNSTLNKAYKMLEVKKQLYILYCKCVLNYCSAVLVEVTFDKRSYLKFNDVLLNLYWTTIQVTIKLVC